ncbi:hypothetical protein KP591P3_00066 [Klebsiella phage KP591P3]|uniref:hypothetical protein n=1 Tax=Klebsiella phage KP591P1 TaxID=2968665 RepID=UPI00233EC83E|nr:hypothetical protein PRB84_gp21 [Klebsiella phage KP591P1]YP_010685479.1 hypothetical protein PRB85_gp52 [Klebsiella phage KP591P3]WAX16302.1 hypothetical protein KP591P1_00021 [Klebsiella phage KP591P1]WAX16422.1 hypothetical protein KP591P3_00066 [Klebsiella phage KP591P3]
MTTDITELALIAKIKKQTENFDTVVLKEWEALALVDALEKAQQRIAELESRTVKLPPCVDDLHGIGMVMSADAVVEALTSYGIKVEAE